MIHVQLGRKHLDRVNPAGRVEQLVEQHKTQRRNKVVLGFFLLTVRQAMLIETEPRLGPPVGPTLNVHDFVRRRAPNLCLGEAFVQHYRPG